MRTGRDEVTIQIQNVLYVPVATMNIVSAGQLMANSIKTFGKGSTFELFATGKLIGECRRPLASSSWTPRM
jgi:hypothetical protein